MQTTHKPHVILDGNCTFLQFCRKDRRRHLCNGSFVTSLHTLTVEQLICEDQESRKTQHLRGKLFFSLYGFAFWISQFTKPVFFVFFVILFVCFIWEKAWSWYNRGTDTWNEDLSIHFSYTLRKALQCTEWGRKFHESFSRFLQSIKISSRAWKKQDPWIRMKAA